MAAHAQTIDHANDERLAGLFDALVDCADHKEGAQLFGQLRSIRPDSIHGLHIQAHGIAVFGATYFNSRYGWRRANLSLFRSIAAMDSGLDVSTVSTAKLV